MAISSSFTFASSAITCVDAIEVAVEEAVDRGADLRLDEPAHLQHARADGLEVLVVLLANVFCHRGSPAQVNALV